VRNKKPEKKIATNALLFWFQVYFWFAPLARVHRSSFLVLGKPFAISRISLARDHRSKRWRKVTSAYVPVKGDEGLRIRTGGTEKTE
jgi:hypothetical protein